MDAPTADVEGCRLSHARLNEHIAGLTDIDVKKPCLLPNWTIGHLLTHIARNADSVVRRLAGAIRDEVADQYVGGIEGRAAEIEQGAKRPAALLIEDVRVTSQAVDQIFDEMTAEVWPRMTRGVSGHEVSAATVVHQRWREVEIHLVDLGLGYSTADFPVGLVDRLLADTLPRLQRRTDPRSLLAWTLGRGPAPELEPWG